MKRRESENNVAGFQDRQPMTCRGVRDAGVGTQSGEIGELSHTPRAQTGESSKAGEIADLPNPAHIALDVGFEVIAERLSWLQSMIVNPRIETRIENIVYDVAGARSLPFG